MMNTNKTIWEKRLPRGFGIFVLLIALVLTVGLGNQAIQIGSKAAVSDIPKDVQISNITPNSFTVSYVTDGSTTGSVSYGIDSKFGSVAFDTRDATNPLNHTVHYISILKLTPATKYFFSIVSGSTNFLNSSAAYQATTAQQPVNAIFPSPTMQLNGQVNLEDGSLPEGIVYLASDNSQLLSTILKQDGSYVLNVNNILKKDLSETLSLTPDTILHMQVVGSVLRSNVTLPANQANPVPQIILSKDYDFTANSTSQSESSASPAAQITPFPNVPNTSPLVQILTPQTGQEFKDQQPQFSGTSKPNSNVEITIQSDQVITTTVSSDSNGSWQYRPDTKLAPGKHTITIKTLNAAGIIQTLTQSFTVFAEGSQFISPSIAPPTPEPTVIVLPTITQAPSPIQPTSTPLPTPIIIIISPTTQPITGTPAPVITSPPIPNSGSSALLFGIATTGSLVGVGFLLFFLI